MQAFRPHRADDQGDEAPPPGPPTLFSEFRVRESKVGRLLKAQQLGNKRGKGEFLAGNGSGNPCGTLEAELARCPFGDQGSPTMNQVMSVPNPRISV
jgi:hypothetical protein